MPDELMPFAGAVERVHDALREILENPLRPASFEECTEAMMVVDQHIYPGLNGLKKAIFNTHLRLQGRA